MTLDKDRKQTKYGHKRETHDTHNTWQRTTWVSLPKNKNSAIKYSTSCCSKPLRPSVMGRSRWEACRSICKHLFTRHGQNISRVEQQQTGKEQARHKSSPVNRWGRSVANVIQGAKRREIIQLHDNSSGRGKQSPNYRTRERSKAGYELQGRQRSDKKWDTQARIKTRMTQPINRIKQDLDSENLEWLHNVATTRRAINARQ